MRSILAVILAFGGSVASALETPDYRVLDWPDASPPAGIELREYQPHLVVETAAAGDFDGARNDAFRRLFRYISGNNTAQAEIAMTTPVTTPSRGVEIEMTAPVTTSDSSDGYWMQFVLPRQYDERTAPQPRDPEVRLRKLPREVVAVIRYSGSSGERNAIRHESRLMEALKAAGLQPSGKPRLAVYNGPFTPWPFRRNEIVVPVALP